MAAPLDSLPLEILLEVASLLDWRSLQRLERVSARCGDAVALHLGRLRVFRVTKADELGSLFDDAELAALLPRLTALQELHVERWTKREVWNVLEELAAASRPWLRLELLTLKWSGLEFGDHRYESAPLGQLCVNCPRLTDVTLDCDADDECVAAVLAALPGLRALRIGESRWKDLQGAWLAQLPAELRQLSIDCRRMCSAAVAQLARCGELRSLELLWGMWLRPADLVAGLAGCARLERLRLTHLNESVSGCLPPTGLHALRHLDLTGCCLKDADLRRLLERLPGLESVCLARCRSTTPSGLTLLGRLPALSSLSLVGADGVSDWVLDRLSAAPLVELQLGGGGVSFARAVTPEGLLRLTQSCHTLRTVKIWANVRLVERVPCGPGVEERHLLQWLRAGMLKMIIVVVSDQRCTHLKLYNTAGAKSYALAHVRR